MNITNEVFGGMWAGASTILVAVLCIGMFVFTGDLVNIGEVIAGLSLALVGFAQVLSPLAMVQAPQSSLVWAGLDAPWWWGRRV